MTPYEPKKIEEKWQKIWEEQRTFKADDNSDKQKFYQLETFPYPSSAGLHVGHPKGYVAEDVHARYLRMNRKEVLYTMGWDAFGLPTENYAIKIGVPPKEVAQDNISNFKRQVKMLGLSYDWDREINTSSPEYYKWTQWIFLQLYKKGLAYKKEAPVNWCPKDQTVLANEQVIDGKCERCGSLVEQRLLNQWFLKITDYAEKLYSDIDKVDWPEKTKTMQKNWVGKSEGAEISFVVEQTPEEISVFTTRPDTLFGATYLVLAPDHSLVKKLKAFAKNPLEIQDYVEKTAQKTDLERLQEEKKKTGVRLDGVTAINPATKKSVPIWIADYVLSSYGTGSIMAVPAHDERDYSFAKEYDLPVIRVIDGGELPYTGEGELIRSGEFNGMTSDQARAAITSAVGGSLKTQYRLRDWLVSRQRYWGVPIPIVYCEKCGEQPVPEEDLPVLLPDDVDFTPTGKPPLATSDSFMNVACPNCGGVAQRDAETLDTFVDSSWYFLRYVDPNNDNSFASKEKLDTWLPVQLYVIGAEHTVLHLLYSRFITKVLFDLGYIAFDEPFLKMRHVGLVLGEDGQKMSKSRGNVVNPDDVVDSFGADTFRMYEMFMGPFEDASPWSTGGITGIFRFLVRVWKLGLTVSEQKASEAILREVHKTTAKVSRDIETFSFNTAVSALMILLSRLEKEPSKESFKSFLLLLYPFAPHLAAELWERCGFEGYIWDTAWPQVDDDYVVLTEVSIVVQVDGKLRGSMNVPVGLNEESVKEKALQIENVSKFVKGGGGKVVFVQDRLINFVSK